MKIKNCLLLFAVIAALFFASCNNGGDNKSKPLTTSSGTSLQDTVLPKLLVKLVHTAGGNYLAYYWTNSLTVDTTQHPPVLKLNAQSAYYDASNTSSVLHNGTSTSQVSSTVSVNNDTVYANYAGPFDPTVGQFYTYKGYLHYTTKLTGDSTICPIASIVYYNQSSSGGPVSIGFVGQVDLHSPKP